MNVIVTFRGPGLDCQMERLLKQRRELMGGAPESASVTKANAKELSQALMAEAMRQGGEPALQLTCAILRAEENHNLEKLRLLRTPLHRLLPVP